MKRLIIYFLAAGIVVALLACSGTQQEPSWKLTNHSDCKQNILDGEVAKNQDCISYEYKDNTLYLRHINAGFNCCPDEFDIDVRIEGKKIIIDETAIDGDCDCLCLYDVDLKISDLQEDTYTIVVLEPLLPKNEEILDFTADLPKEKTGKYCAERNSYPWGM